MGNKYSLWAQRLPFRTTENHPILNQIYDTLAELHNQGKLITLCKIPTHIRIKGNEETDKAIKKAIDMPGMTMTTISHRLLPDY